MPSGSTLKRLLLAQRQPFMLVGQDARILDLNGALAAFSGQEQSDLIGAPCCGLDLIPSAPCRHQRFFRDLEPYIDTLALRGCDGTQRMARVQGFPVVDDRGIILLGESIRPVSGEGATDAMIGQSAAMRLLRHQLAQAAMTEAAVLLLGETGSGKELAAQQIHRLSPRCSAPFIVVDCTVLNDELFESELFGHVKGAFTGAVANKTGLIELADGGTLFFDEIGELPLAQQPKLLRVLETGSYRPVGANQARRVNLRIVSATHQDLQAMVRQREFRPDLYYRLAVLPLRVPTLRERKDDIPILAAHLLRELSSVQGAIDYRLLDSALERLRTHDYPGNIRELRNILHLAAALCQGGRIRAEEIHLPDLVPVASAPPPLPDHAPDAREERATTTRLLLSPVEAAEADYIMELMRRHRGSRRAVADSMAVSERTLYRKLKRYGLNQAQQAVS